MDIFFEGGVNGGFITKLVSLQVNQSLICAAWAAMAPHQSCHTDMSSLCPPSHPD